ncbi:hypothetical protein V8D89_001572 [Ganoderma adspersum]
MVSSEQTSPLAAAMERVLAVQRTEMMPAIDMLQPTQYSAPDLFSNDDLSLTRDPALRAAALEKLYEADLLMGSGGSRAMNGNTLAHVNFEARMRNFFGAPAALLCGSGYDANLAFWRSVPQSGDAIVLDELVHASTREGMAACRAKRALYPFKHNSIESFRECLLKALEEHPAISAGKSTVFVAVEGMYSMDGDFAPLPEIVRMTDELVPHKFGHIMVDEAHSTVFYGPQGRGLVAALGSSGRIDTVLHTFGKARAASGAVLLSSAIVQEYIVNYSRGILYTTSLSGPFIAILNASFDRLESRAGDRGRDRLRTICLHFRRLLEDSLKDVPPTVVSLRPPSTAPQGFPSEIVSPIFPILTQHPQSLAAHLVQLGYACRAMLHPMVPSGEERIRVIVHAENQPQELLDLVSHILGWAETMQGRGVQSGRRVSGLAYKM